MRKPLVRVVTLVLGAVRMKFIEIHRDNYKQIAEIYKEGIDTKIATFETEVPDWEIWNQKYHQFGRTALLENNQILGWASLSLVSKREVYKGVAEVSIYIKYSERGKGLGEILLRKLIKESEKNSIYSLQSSIFTENKASLCVHKKCGFRVIGYKEKIAQLSGIWKDNIILERRSTLFL